MRAAFVRVLVGGALVLSTAGTPPPVHADDQLTFSGVVKVNTVNVDVVVTHDDQLVTDLTQADFEILEDGQPRTVTNFTRIVEGTVHLPDGGTVADSEDLRFHRHLALVFDLNFTERPRLEQAAASIKRYVHAHADDGIQWSVTIVGPSSRVLQPFTDDVSRVSAAIDQVLEQPTYRLAADVDSSLIDDPLRSITLNGGVGRAAKGADKLDKLKRLGQRELARRSLQIYYSYMRSLLDIFRAYSSVPGNKACLLVTGNMSFNANLSHLASMGDPTTTHESEPKYDWLLVSTQHQVNQVWNEMTRLASTTGFRVYVINAMGLEEPMTHNRAEYGSGGSATADRPSESEADWETLPRMLADGTGGQYFNSNDVGPALATTGERMSTYYSLGFDAPHDHDGAYHTIEVKVRRKGVRVAFREGLYDLDRESVVAEELASPATLPKRGGSLPLIVQVDAHRTKDGTEVATTAITPAARLTFLPEGNHDVARVGILLAVYDQNGDIMDLKRKSQVIELPLGASAKITDQPFTYTIRFDKPKDAATVAMALYDAGSGLDGVASAAIATP